MGSQFSTAIHKSILYERLSVVAPRLCVWNRTLFPIASHCTLCSCRVFQYPAIGFTDKNTREVRRVIFGRERGNLCCVVWAERTMSTTRWGGRLLSRVSRSVLRIFCHFSLKFPNTDKCDLLEIYSQQTGQHEQCISVSKFNRKLDLLDFFGLQTTTTKHATKTVCAAGVRPFRILLRTEQIETRNVVINVILRGCSSDQTFVS